MEVTFLIFLFILGTCFGSFLCCQARRLHYRATKPQKGSKPSRPRPKSPSAPKLPSRSVCLHCHKKLKWYDNLPILSWLFLKGRCRHCHQKFGAAELISELATGLAWLALGTTVNITAATPLEWSIFAATLILTLLLIFLAIYDGLYGELPTSILTISIICAIIVLTLKVWAILSISSFTPDLIWQPLGAVLILGGLYLILHLVSKGKWVGDGDWILALALALALANSWLALITLFLANLFACFYALPTLKKTRQIHFGPFLVTAFIFTLTFADFLQSML